MLGFFFSNKFGLEIPVQHVLCKLEERTQWSNSSDSNVNVFFWLTYEANAQPPIQTISPALGEVATPGHQNISIEMRKLSVKSYVVVGCCMLWWTLQFVGWKCRSSRCLPVLQHPSEWSMLDIQNKSEIRQLFPLTPQVAANIAWNPENYAKLLESWKSCTEQTQTCALFLAITHNPKQQLSNSKSLHVPHSKVAV